MYPKMNEWDLASEKSEGLPLGGDIDDLVGMM